MSSSLITAEFIPSVRGRIFVLARHPKNFDGRCVLVVPPFAEEMNKSRKMITELAQRLTPNGIGIVVPDFFGTGDSEGDFADTDCTAWFGDLVATETWMQKKGWSLHSILGIRLGCTIAAEYTRRRANPIAQTVFWQPMLDGARALEQFLRLRVAASLMEDKKETVADLKVQFASGKVVEVAGYGVSSVLAAQIELLKMISSATAKLGRVEWFEVLRSTEAAVPVPANKAIELLSAAGIQVTLHTTVGEPFWASAEIVCLPGLLDATAEALQSHAR